MKAKLSLFDQIGGSPAIEAAVKEFYKRILADEELAPFFEGVNMARHIHKVRAFLVTALGGPEIYRGPDMKQAHAHLAISEKTFGQVAQHLVETLAALDVPQSIIEDVVETISPLSTQIVNLPPHCI